MPDIRINQLPLASGGTSPAPADFVAIDGTTTRKAPLSALGDVIRPFASQAQAEAGVSADTSMSPLTTAQAIDVQAASAAQGAKADTAMQPSLYDPNSIGADVFNPINLRDFATVQDLLSDNNIVIGYVGSLARIKVVVGSKVRAGDFSYEVVAANAGITTPVTAQDFKDDANAWHIKTAGGVKLKQLIGATVGYVAAAFGALASASDNYAPFQRLLDTGSHCIIGMGDFKCSKELDVMQINQRIIGAARGFGYTANTEEFIPGVGMVPIYSNPVFNWRHGTTIRFTGTGNRRVRTRVLFRGSAADPQDATMSAGLNIQADGVQLENFCVFNDITPPVSGPAGELSDSISNFGADWDIGIFIGSRQNVHLTDVAVIGYHRKANIWGDATQCERTQRFLSERGFVYPQGVTESGADGTLLERVYTSGGLWGVNVQSAKPKVGATTYGDPYYDQFLGATVTDTRGLWGWSDFAIKNSQIFGANHHTRTRLVDMKAVPDAKADWDVGGAFSIDGLAVNDNNAIHGHRYENTRFQSYAPFCVRIDRSARDNFMGCMIESPQPYVKARATGIAIGTATTANNFGGLCATDNHSFLFIVESQAPYYLTYTQLKYGDSVWSNSSLANRATQISYNELRIISDVQANTSRIYLGYVGNPTAATISRSSTNSLVFVTSNAFTALNASAANLFSVAASGNALFYGNAYPANDNTNSSGIITNRWSVVYSATAAINTSDGRLKLLRDGKSEISDTWEVSPLSEAELKAALELADELGAYKFKDSVTAKGEDARIHIGLTVQKAIEVLEKNGLFAFEYSFICYDEWDASDAVYDLMGDEDTGFTEVMVEPARAAGSVYSFRESGLHSFIIKGIMNGYKSLEKRVEKLEAIA